MSPIGSSYRDDGSLKDIETAVAEVQQIGPDFAACEERYRRAVDEWYAAEHKLKDALTRLVEKQALYAQAHDVAKYVLHQHSGVTLGPRPRP